MKTNEEVKTLKFTEEYKELISKPAKPTNKISKKKLYFYKKEGK